MNYIKRYYLSLLDKNKKNFLDITLYSILYLLSFVYGLIVFIRNIGYDFRIFPVYTSEKKVISIGNISWGGAGKTTMVSYLHEKLSSRFPTASITKGYARDEFLMLKNQLCNVFDARDRVSLLKSLRERFDVFILDDGFQYRKLKRDLDIVILTERELSRRRRLLPAYILREPVSSLKRADIIVINYRNRIGNVDKMEEEIFSINPQARIYFADYVCKGFISKDKKSIDIDYFENKKVGVLTAIGYPGGFINMLVGLGIDIGKKVIYPDHHNFDMKELFNIENIFKNEGIKDIIITQKDFYHLDFKKAKLNYLIMEAGLKIENEENFLREVNKFIK